MISVHGMNSMAFYFTIALLSTALVVLSIAPILHYKNHPIEPSSQETLPIEIHAPYYPLSDVHAATDNFNPTRTLGEGRLGTAYAALLASDQTDVVVVKRIHPRLVLCNPGFGFSSTIRSLSLAQHPHVVPILGYSEAPGERIILMEFAGTVSLDRCLNQKAGASTLLLDWAQRVKVAAGAARGLEYLHEQMAPSVVHGCVKSSNILIDVKFCARISDYGLYFLTPGTTSKRGPCGGGIYADSGGASKESDVYGFGVVLLELLTGRSGEEHGSLLLVEWALPLIEGMRFHELLDPRLAIPKDIKPLVRLSKVALACVGNSRKSRPSIAQITAILTGLEMETLSINHLLM